MTKRQTDLAFALTETWINGNRSDVMRALKKEKSIVAAAIALQIASNLQRPDGLDNSDFPNAIDRLAGEWR